MRAARAARERMREARWARDAGGARGAGPLRLFVEVDVDSDGDSDNVTNPAYWSSMGNAREDGPREEGQTEDPEAVLREAEAEAREAMRVAEAARDRLKEARGRASREGQARKPASLKGDQRRRRRDQGKIPAEINIGSSRIAKPAHRRSRLASDQGKVLESPAWVDTHMDLILKGGGALANVDDYIVEDWDGRTARSRASRGRRGVPQPTAPARRRNILARAAPTSAAGAPLASPSWRSGRKGPSQSRASQIRAWFRAKEASGTAEKNAGGGFLEFAREGQRINNSGWRRQLEKFVRSA